MISICFPCRSEEQQKEKTEKAVPTNVAPYHPQNVAPLLGTVLSIDDPEAVFFSH